MIVDTTSAIIIVVGLVGAGMINELVKIFFAKMRNTDFVDKSSCQKCQTASHLYDSAQGQKIDSIAKLVLAMAIKLGVDVKEIQGIL